MDSVEENVHKRQCNADKETETREGKLIGQHHTAGLSLVELGLEFRSSDFQARLFVIHCSSWSFVEYVKCNKPSNSLCVEMAHTALGNCINQP